MCSQTNNNKQQQTNNNKQTTKLKLKEIKLFNVLKINYLNKIKQPQTQWFFYKLYKLEFGQNNQKTQPLSRK